VPDGLHTRGRLRPNPADVRPRHIAECSPEGVADRDGRPGACDAGGATVEAADNHSLKETPKMDLPEDLIGLLRQPSSCYVATTMPDGSPQLTQTWVDTDGEHVLINTVQGFQKAKNVERDPRVAVSVSDPSNPSRYYSVRGRVVNATTEGGAEHIEILAQRYLGGPYPWYGGRDEVRLILSISADRIHQMG
jgi:PPOX class probable F420-dependent enzyme